MWYSLLRQGVGIVSTTNKKESKMTNILSVYQKNVPCFPSWVTRIVEDVNPTLTPTGELSFCHFMYKDEVRISGTEMRRRAKKMHANAGLADVPRLLEKDTIFPDLEKYYIVLPGTLVLDSFRRENIPCLRFNGKKWKLHFCWLVYDWNYYGRLVSCR